MRLNCFHSAMKFVADVFWFSMEFGVMREHGVPVIAIDIDGNDVRAAAKAIEEAYVAEYGREIDEQSCLNFLLFIHADRRSKFTPFGVFSDERYHIVEGNDDEDSALREVGRGMLVLPRAAFEIAFAPLRAPRAVLLVRSSCGGVGSSCGAASSPWLQVMLPVSLKRASCFFSISRCSDWPSSFV